MWMAQRSPMSWANDTKDELPVPLYMFKIYSANLPQRIFSVPFFGPSCSCCLLVAPPVEAIPMCASHLGCASSSPESEGLPTGADAPVAVGVVPMAAARPQRQRVKLCVICLDVIHVNASHLVEALPCAHVFHSACLNGWRHSTGCPKHHCPMRCERSLIHIEEARGIDLTGSDGSLEESPELEEQDLQDEPDEQYLDQLISNRTQKRKDMGEIWRQLKTCRLQEPDRKKMMKAIYGLCKTRRYRISLDPVTQSRYRFRPAMGSGNRASNQRDEYEMGQANASLCPNF